MVLMLLVWDETMALPVAAAAGKVVILAMLLVVVVMQVAVPDI